MSMSPILAAAALVLCAACAAPAADPPLEPKPCRIGIAPSHITTPTAPLFAERVDEWDEVRESIDFYKADRLDDDQEPTLGGIHDRRRHEVEYAYARP